MRDPWKNDPDRTTRNDDTRTPERVTADMRTIRCDYPFGTGLKCARLLGHSGPCGAPFRYNGK